MNISCSFQKIANKSFGLILILKLFQSHQCQVPLPHLFGDTTACPRPFLEVWYLKKNLFNVGWHIEHIVLLEISSKSYDFIQL